MAVSRVAFLALFLSACSTATVGEHQNCLPLKTYSAADQTKLLVAYQALPSDSPLKPILQDYFAMRDADRACLGAKQ